MMGGSLLIDNRSYYSSKERSAVNFPHEKHMEKGIDCTRCHHDYLDEKNILDSDKLEVGNNEIKCINCHGKSGKARERHKLQQAYHGQCINCHRKIIGSRGGRPPLLCGECHTTHGKIK